MRQVRRDDRGPKAGPDYPIIRVIRPGFQIFRCCQKFIYGCWTHWDGQQSIPCTGENQECHGHSTGLPLRWKGFLHVFGGDNNVEGFLEITPSGRDQIWTQMGEKTSLRGLRLKVTRGAGGKKSRLRIEVMPDIANGEGLVEEKDPWITLGPLWEMKKCFGPNA